MSQNARIERWFTNPAISPLDEVEWERRDARLTNEKGETVFEQRDIEVPRDWSQTAVNIVASKYFRGALGQPEREWSVRQMIGRVVSTIVKQGRIGDYFATDEDAATFEAELAHLLVRQKAAFNSPVWFNVGVNPHPQCSACFIQSVKDDMRSIMELATSEVMLFKGGSGTGTNLSTLRSSHENLGGSSGKSSGPVSFMRGFDSFAGVIKSGGKTRRAAKMVILNVGHPDIHEFVWCKAKEERKARVLIAAGYDGSLNGEAYASVSFQNANNSVRVTDEFMRAALEDGGWTTRAVTTGQPVETMPAKKLLEEISQAAWECGDPGLQYDTTVNRWNPVANSGRINGSNPCSEFMFLDDSACNLASINLMRFVGADGEFDVASFQHAVDVLITAQEILVEFSSYPTPAIERNSRDFRPLGLGYANLGALLMSRGLAYDSDEGRNYAAVLTAILTGRAYSQSAVLAAELGAFRRYRENDRSFLGVIGMHREAAYAIPDAGVPADLLAAARSAWDEAIELGAHHGFRNAQVSVLAPTGTIGFLMDCDTTGIEPDLALVKYKWLVGGGLIKIVNQTVPEALTRLGYAATEREAILKWLDQRDAIEGAPGLKPEHLPVFDCAFKPAKGSRAIHYLGHVRMMAAVQPFISGAISKTVNMPREATVDDVRHVYVEGWKLGLKAIAIYRDGCKSAQPVRTSKESSAGGGDTVGGAPSAGAAKASTAGVETGAGPAPASAALAVPASTAPLAPAEARAQRRRLSDERRSLTHKFSVAGHEGYITVGLYEDGAPGELFIRMSKGGSIISGLMDALATSVSIALQYGVPLRVLVNKFVHVRFEPSGITSNPQIRFAKSLVDYIARWLATKFLTPEEQIAIGLKVEMQTLGDQSDSEVRDSAAPDVDKAPAATAKLPLPGVEALTATFTGDTDAPPCDTCGSLMVRSAACYKCLNCGGTSGCS